MTLFRHVPTKEALPLDDQFDPSMTEAVRAQEGALAGSGGWMPLAAPALWAISDGTAVTTPQLAVAGVVAVTSTVLTCEAWKRLQLDR